MKTGYDFGDIDNEDVKLTVEERNAVRVSTLEVGGNTFRIVEVNDGNQRTSSNVGALIEFSEFQTAKDAHEAACPGFIGDSGYGEIFEFQG